MNKKLKPIHDHIVFQFIDESIRLNDMTQFVDKTNWGFLVSTVQRGMDYPRVGTVIATGPKVEGKVNPGDHILIEPGMWTIGAKFESDEYWRTDLTHVMAIVSEPEIQSEPKRHATYLS